MEDQSFINIMPHTGDIIYSQWFNLLSLTGFYWIESAQAIEVWL